MTYADRLAHLARIHFAEAGAMSWIIMQVQIDFLGYAIPLLLMNPGDWDRINKEVCRMARLFGYGIYHPCYRVADHKLN